MFRSILVSPFLAILHACLQVISESWSLVGLAMTVLWLRSRLRRLSRGSARQPAQPRIDPGHDQGTSDLGGSQGRCWLGAQCTDLQLSSPTLANDCAGRLRTPASAG